MREDASAERGAMGPCWRRRSCVLREVVTEAEKPVMLYSAGKDGAVMLQLHLARKAFYPSPPPFPLFHVDMTWTFQAMYELRDRMARESGMELLVYQRYQEYSGVPAACRAHIGRETIWDRREQCRWKPKSQRFGPRCSSLRISRRSRI